MNKYVCLRRFENQKYYDLVRVRNKTPSQLEILDVLEHNDKEMVYNFNEKLGIYTWSLKYVQKYEHIYLNKHDIVFDAEDDNSARLFIKLKLDF